MLSSRPQGNSFPRCGPVPAVWSQLTADLKGHAPGSTSRSEPLLWFNLNPVQRRISTAGAADQVDLVAKQHQLLSIPMMAEVLGWRQRVAAEPVAEPLAHVLDVCSERLLANFERYVHDSVRTRPPAILFVKRG